MFWSNLYIYIYIHDLCCARLVSMVWEPLLEMLQLTLTLQTKSAALKPEDSDPSLNDALDSMKDRRKVLLVKETMAVGVECQSPVCINVAEVFISQLLKV